MALFLFYHNTRLFKKNFFENYFKKVLTYSEIAV